MLGCLLHLIALVAVRVSGAAVARPPSTLDSISDFNSSSANLKEPPILHSERWRNGTITYHGKPNISPRPDAILGNNPKQPLVAIEVPDCGTPTYICDERYNHAALEACETLIYRDMKEDPYIPPKAQSICYSLDWDVDNTYKCCVSWSNVDDRLDKKVLFTNADELYKRCNMYDNRLKFNVISGRLIHATIWDDCATQCLSNKAWHCA